MVTATLLKKDIFKISEHLPEELQNELSLRQIRHWSNLEAQFELASLLAHPKQVFGNIFGGSLHTISSAGSKYLRKARDMNYVKRIIPEVSTKEDLNTWVIERGVFPEFIAHELGLAPELRTANGREFVKAVTKRLTKTGDMPEETILELANKYKIKEGKNIMELFPDVQFYDYTKLNNRFTKGQLPANYHLTFSRAEDNDHKLKEVLKLAKTY